MSEKHRVCFVIGPIGEPNSDARIHSDWLLEEIIEPIISDFQDFEVVRADKIAQPGMIDAQIIRLLLDADLVIADLSKLNPNAFYELGIRHMAQKPIIHMQLLEDVIPFDVSLYRATKFARTRPSDLREAKVKLKAAVEAVLAEEYVVDNPITRARGQIQLERTATPEQRVIMDKLAAFEVRLAAVEGQEIGVEHQRPSLFSGPVHDSIGNADDLIVLVKYKRGGISDTELASILQKSLGGLVAIADVLNDGRVRFHFPSVPADQKRKNSIESALAKTRGVVAFEIVERGWDKH